MIEDKDISLSIIIPCYNCSKWIERTINSLVSQSDKRFEVVFINDGSKDDSINLINYLLDGKELVYKIINQKNSGVSIARNTGIKNSNGKYIYFLDSDDYIENNFISYLLDKLNEEKVDMYFFNYYLNKEKKYLKPNIYQKFMRVQLNNDVLLDLLREKFNYHMCAFIIKKDIIIKAGIKFTPKVKYGEDHEFLIKCLCNCKRVIVDDTALFNYCINENTVTQKFTLDRFDSIDSAYRIYKYIEERYNDNEIRLASKAYVASKLVHNLREYAIIGCNDKLIEKKLYENIKSNEYIKYYKYYNRNIIDNIIINIILFKMPSIYMNSIRGLSRLKNITKCIVKR